MEPLEIYIARIAHEINRAYCASMGDLSQPAWDDAPTWQRESAIKGVTFHLEHPDATPENSHESWLVQKVVDGWVYGEVKDAEAKTHPCLRPYAELPAEQRAKDYLFKAVVALHAPEPRNGGIVAANPERPLTYGEAAVGLAFNPSGDPEVYECKRQFAAIIDQMDRLRKRNDLSPEIKRMTSVAITEAQTAQMWAVKAITWKD